MGCLLSHCFDRRPIPTVSISAISILDLSVLLNCIVLAVVVFMICTAAMATSRSFICLFVVRRQGSTLDPVLRPYELVQAVSPGIS